MERRREGGQRRRRREREKASRGAMNVSRLSGIKEKVMGSKEVVT